MKKRVDPLNFPELGPHVPRRGNGLTRAIGRAVLRLLGWRFEGAFPDLPKYVIVGAPHTSYWDAIIALATIFGLGIDVHWMAKREAFDHPLGGLLVWLGGIPVDRSASHGVVDQTIEAFNCRDQFILVITPEGTRKKVARWKTGFYRIAHGADVPLVLGYADYQRKVVGIGSVVLPTGDMEKDIANLRAFFRQIPGKNPHLY